MYQTKTMEKLEMIECPKCGEPMPLNKTKTEITPNRIEDRNLQGPLTILETDK